MPRFVPPSIEDEGLEAFLNAGAKKHNGLDFRVFKILATPMPDGRRRVNSANLARAFNVSRPTIEKWLTYL